MGLPALPSLSSTTPLMVAVPLLGPLPQPVVPCVYAYVPPRNSTVSPAFASCCALAIDASGAASVVPALASFPVGAGATYKVAAACAVAGTSQRQRASERGRGRFKFRPRSG